jgi:hypothetical protein
MFCNMYRAWESLSPLYREWLDGRYALHDMSVARETRLQRTPAELEDIRRRNPPVYQPIARRHDVTGKKGALRERDDDGLDRGTDGGGERADPVVPLRAQHAATRTSTGTSGSRPT